MTQEWHKPAIVEIKMDCEINSYGDDLPGDDFPPYSFVTDKDAPDADSPIQVSS